MTKAERTLIIINVVQHYGAVSYTHLGAFEVFVATLVVCTVTALVILTSGVYDETAALLAIQSGGVDSSMLGLSLIHISHGKASAPGSVRR